MKKFLAGTAGFFIFLVSYTSAKCQEVVQKKTMLSGWEGMAVAGYVDHGSYINFGGPSIKLVKKPWSFGFGILPTMRVKRDKAAKGVSKNAAITPTAGFGFTFTYRHLVLQVPFYYNAKTNTSDGKWNPGVGVGFKF